MYWWIPFALQALIMLFDEAYFHIRRGLPRWERWGHPLDTLSVIVCIGWVLLVPFSSMSLKIYGIFALISCLLVTKDEWVHKEHCPATEQWVHALLFTLHPILLIMVGIMWAVSQGVPLPSWIDVVCVRSPLLIPFLWGECAVLVLFFIYQIIFWNILWDRITR